MGTPKPTVNKKGSRRRHAQYLYIRVGQTACGVRWAEFALPVRRSEWFDVGRREDGRRDTPQKYTRTSRRNLISRYRLAARKRAWCEFVRARSESGRLKFGRRFTKINLLAAAFAKCFSAVVIYRQQCSRLSKDSASAHSRVFMYGGGLRVRRWREVFEGHDEVRLRVYGARDYILKWPPTPPPRRPPLEQSCLRKYYFSSL